jgi:hypothetical protein
MRQIARSVLKDEFLLAAEQVLVEIGADRVESACAPELPA